eukprot:SAG31_NODE_43940_length_265_cov_0.614458_1_plen_44_part_01
MSYFGTLLIDRIQYASFMVGGISSISLHVARPRHDLGRDQPWQL